MKDGPTVRAKCVVVATNTPINDWVTIHTKQAPYRTYVIGNLVPKERFRRRCIGTHSIRITMFVCSRYSNRQDVLIVGGEDHKTGQATDTDSRFDHLESWARPSVPESRRHGVSGGQAR